MAIKQWLSHPLVLLLVGALISSYLIPTFTNQWQLRQNELELKTSLISQINESVTDMIMSIQFAELGAMTQEDFNEDYRESQIKRAVIESYLSAYFPNTPIPHKWASLSSLIEDFYALVGIHEPSRREAHLQKIKQEYFAESRIDWDSNTLMDKGNPNYINNWFLLKDGVVNQKDELIQNIIQSHMPAFS
jgi:hypothetical protein